MQKKSPNLIHLISRKISQRICHEFCVEECRYSEHHLSHVL